ncbi:MAG: hypothetical protein AAFY98_02365 [Verrucomicrobiota bacterium]
MNTIEAFIGEVDRGLRTKLEFRSFLWQELKSSNTLDLVTDLQEHSEEFVRAAAAWCIESHQNEVNLVTDIREVRETSVFAANSRVRFSSGYDGSKSWWLNGGSGYDGAFVDFTFVREGSLPAAIIELDSQIDLTEGTGLRHFGAIALARVRWSGTPWQTDNTVVVHIVSEIPSDTEEFFRVNDMMASTEIESHASLSIETRPNKAE